MESHFVTLTYGHGSSSESVQIAHEHLIMASTLFRELHEVDPEGASKLSLDNVAFKHTEASVVKGAMEMVKKAVELMDCNSAENALVSWCRNEARTLFDHRKFLTFVHIMDFLQLRDWRTSMIEPMVYELYASFCRINFITSERAYYRWIWPSNLFDWACLTKRGLLVIFMSSGAFKTNKKRKVAEYMKVVCEATHKCVFIDNVLRAVHARLTELSEYGEKSLRLVKEFIDIIAEIHIGTTAGVSRKWIEDISRTLTHESHKSAFLLAMSGFLGDREDHVKDGELRFRWNCGKTEQMFKPVSLTYRNTTPNTYLKITATNVE
jgi:hypothetical protein